jgi:hypothetical protein
LSVTAEAEVIKAGPVEPVEGGPADGDVREVER